MSRPKPGDLFTHDQILEPTWKPSRTQVWRDAPKAQMKVTSVADGHVHYTYVKPGRDHSRLSFEMPQHTFLARFGATLRPNLSVVDGEGYHDLVKDLTAVYDRLRAVPDTEERS